MTTTLTARLFVGLIFCFFRHCFICFLSLSFMFLSDFMPEKKPNLEKRDSLAEKKSNSITIANNSVNNMNGNSINNNQTSNYCNSQGL